MYARNFVTLKTWEKTIQITEQVGDWEVTQQENPMRERVSRGETRAQVALDGQVEE